MAIDSNIYQLAGRGVKSVAEYDAEASTARQNKLAEMMGGMKMDEARRGLAGENALAQLLAGGKSGADVATGLASQGFGKQSLAYTKQTQDMAKDKTAMEKDQLAMTVQKLSLGAQILGSAKDQSSYDAARATAQANGLDVSRMPPQFDPAFVAQKLQEGMSMKEQLEQKWKQMEYATPNANAVLSADTQAAGQQIQRNGQQVQIRGQDMTDARARESNDAKVKENEIKREQGGGAGAATEGERKAATLLQRLEFSEKQLEAALKDSPGAAAPSLISNGLESIGMDAAANSTKSTARQQVTAAQLDILDAALTLGTGAAYTNEQLKGYAKSYFAQIGDDKKTLEDKTARLKNVIDAAKIAAGRARPKQSAEPAGKAPPVKDKAAFDALPSGATFTAPDGSVRRKP